jgi:3-hydroxyacyl-[acyl-carrier-protein] dehydratase
MDASAAGFTMPLDVEMIQQIIPHRYPFLLVDRIVDMQELTVVGIKSVTANEPFFQGHFPQKKVMPGVLQIEAMAQTGAVWLLAKPENKGKIALLAAVKEARFRRPVVPGDQLRIECEIISMRSRMGVVRARCLVEDQVTSEAEITFAFGRESASETSSVKGQVNAG